MQGANIYRALAAAGAVLVLGLSVLASAGAATSSESVHVSVGRVGEAVDVSAETRALMEEHYVGCGSLNWVLTGAPEAARADASATFLVAEVAPGKVLAGYFNADRSKPIQYTDKTGTVRQVKLLLPNGVLLLPEADTSALVWQEGT